MTGMQGHQPAWGPQQPVTGLHQSPAWGPPQQRGWGQSAPASQSPWGQQPSPAPHGHGWQVAGEPLVPAVVIFGDGPKANLDQLLVSLDPTAAAAVVSARPSKHGAPRCVLHCKVSSLPLVQSLVPLLRRDRVPAAVFVKPSGPGVTPKTQQAQAGLDAATANAGVCNYYAMSRPCPFFEKDGKCRFACYGGPATG